MSESLIWVRHAVLLLGCGILGGWMWTELAPQPPIDGGILSPAGTVLGLLGGAVISIAWCWLEG